MENRIKEAELEKAFLELGLDDFLGLAQIAQVNIFDENNKIRHDFRAIEREILDFYSALPKEKRNKFLRQVRRICKYNRIHKLEEFENTEDSSCART